MDSSGKIATFETQGAAAAAGYITALTSAEMRDLKMLPHADRHGYLENRRTIDANRAKAKAARKARRENR